MLSEVQLTDRFKRDFKKLDSQLQARVEEIIRDELFPWPTRRSLRHHTLSGYRPPIHVLDVTTNHSHQLTFECDGSIAKLLRVGTHKQIDGDPRG